MKVIYIDPNGVVKYNAEWPEKPAELNNEDHSSYYDELYESALSKAKQESVSFADQENTIKTLGLVGVYSPVPNSHYPLPEGIEVEVTIKNHPECGEDKGEKCSMHCHSVCEKLENPTLLAYIKSSSPEKQESQEELWEYFTETLNKYVTKPMHPLAIKALQKHFTIIRNK